MAQIKAERTAGPVTVCFPFVGESVGGSHISAFKLIAALDRARFRPLVVIHRPGSKADRLLEKFGIARELAPPAARDAPLSLLGELAATRLGAAYLLQRGARIVHSNDGASHVVWAPRAKLARAQVVWHHRATPDARGLRWLAPWAADWVIAVSRFAAPRPGLWSAARKCSVIPSPFDAGLAQLDRVAARSAVCAELGVEPQIRLIGYFGNLVPRKRPLVFVRVIAALTKIAPEVPVLGLFFGEAKLDLDLKAVKLAQELGVADRVRLMGFRFPPEPWLAACDVLLAPSVDEPFGRSIIEAMLVGTPVVASASGGNLEAIDDGRTGFLVPVESVEIMAARAHALLLEPALAARIAEAARHEALSRYGVTRHADAVMAIYDRLLTGGNDPETVGKRGLTETHD